MPLTLRIDPWASEYEGALQLAGETDDNATPPAGLRLNVEAETADWRPVAPQPGGRPRAVFVDGVRRVEVGVIREESGKMGYGLFGSYAAGAVVCNADRAAVERRQIARRIVVGGGSLHPCVRVEAGSATLEFEGHAEPENSPKAVLQELQQLMRRLEGDVARPYAAEDSLTFVDGPLTFLLPLEEPILGYVKTLYRSYLPGELMTVLHQTGPGERTPVFGFGEGSATRYSWYLRLAAPGPLDHSLAGVVRLEVSSSVGDREAVKLADLSASLLPHFASHPAWDARAPQNLFPISALESDLHHSLGDHRWVRRAIQDHLMSEERA